MTADLKFHPGRITYDCDCDVIRRGGSTSSSNVTGIAVVEGRESHPNVAPQHSTPASLQYLPSGVQHLPTSPASLIQLSLRPKTSPRGRCTEIKAPEFQRTD